RRALVERRRGRAGRLVGSQQDELLNKHRQRSDARGLEEEWQRVLRGALRPASQAGQRGAVPAEQEPGRHVRWPAEPEDPAGGAELARGRLRPDEGAAEGVAAGPHDGHARREVPQGG
ncbi:unnamed protein product, partial [Prorocentrum cordatum]